MVYMMPVGQVIVGSSSINPIDLQSAYIYIVNVNSGIYLIISII